MSVLYGVGVGPGDPELLTLRARQVLQRVTVVAAVAAEGRCSRALEIARPHLPADVEVRVQVVPMGSREAAEAAYAEFAASLGRILETGREVALLCEGDPLFYGSFIYLQRHFKGRFNVRVIPGITAVSAAAAVLVHPLACQDQGVAVLPASAGQGRLRSALESFDTVIILKAGRERQVLAGLIREVGRAAEARYCEEVECEGARLLGLDELPPGPGSYFSLFLVSRGCP